MTSLLWPCCGGGETPEDTRVKLYPRNSALGNNSLSLPCEWGRSRRQQKANYFNKTKNAVEVKEALAARKDQVALTSNAFHVKNVNDDGLHHLVVEELWSAITLAKDLMHPLAEVERRKHKKKRLVQSPNSYFMDVKCPGCYRITTVFSHAQRVVPCGGCSYVLCQPKGGKCRLTEGRKSSFPSSLVYRLYLRPVVPRTSL
ncbi:RS272 protein, partial [Polyodon spathula]|nr:RS272 protein [Polyodon spathula]